MYGCELTCECRMPKSKKPSSSSSSSTGAPTLALYDQDGWNVDTTEEIDVDKAVVEDGTSRHLLVSATLTVQHCSLIVDDFTYKKVTMALRAKHDADSAMQTYVSILCNAPKPTDFCKLHIFYYFTCRVTCKQMFTCTFAFLHVTFFIYM